MRRANPAPAEAPRPGVKVSRYVLLDEGLRQLRNPGSILIRASGDEAAEAAMLEARKDERVKALFAEVALAILDAAERAVHRAQGDAMADARAFLDHAAPFHETAETRPGEAQA